MKLGIDISTYLEELAHGARYFDGDKEIDPLDAFLQNGVSLVRIRVWNDPKDENGAPYLGGGCDLQNFLQLAKRVTENGFGLLLDLHYSDFWADPGKQTIPKAWTNHDAAQLAEDVFAYTRDTIRAIRAAGIPLQLVQIGNEITNGMLWPAGRLTERADGGRDGYATLAKLLNAGARACRAESPASQIVLHLERSNDGAVYQEFFSNMAEFGVDYDVIGASYYPYWHGTTEELFANLNACKRFGKRIMVMELGYGFTLENYILQGGAARLVVDGDSVQSFGFAQHFPLTPAGQAAFVADFLLKARQNGLDAVFYWEPLWIPGEGICWASAAGQAYIGESGKSTVNEWANQCLFDYTGHKLPACDAFCADLRK